MSGLALFSNNAATTLASSINSSVTSLSVASGTGALFPSPTGSQYFYCTLANNAGAVEIVKVTARSTDTFTIVRGQDGTTAASWTIGDKVELRLVNANLTNFGQLDSTNTWAQAQTFNGGASLGTALNIASGGTNNGSLGVTAGGVYYGDGSKVMETSAGTSGQVLTSNGSGAPTWGPAGFSGSTTTTSAVDISLTNSSTQTQKITMTASGKFVTLPDATTLSTKGGVIYNIINNGSNPFGIKLTDGSVFLPTLGYGYQISLVLTDNSTANGQWAILYSNYTSSGQIFISKAATSYSSTALPSSQEFLGFSLLSSSLVVMSYMDTSTNFIYVVAGSISGTTITWGTAVRVGSNAAQDSNASGMCRMTSTQGMITYRYSNGTTTRAVYACGFSVSGNTVTAGTQVTVSSNTASVDLNCWWDINLTDNLNVICYEKNGSNNQLRAVTISGTTLTLGAEVATNTPRGTANPQIAVIDTATFFYSDNNKPRIGTVSGTTITLGTAGASSLTQYGAYAQSTGGTIVIPASNIIYCGINKIVYSGTSISSVSTISNQVGGTNVNLYTPMGQCQCLLVNGKYIDGLADVQLADTSDVGATYNQGGLGVTSYSPPSNNLIVSGNKIFQVDSTTILLPTNSTYYGVSFYKVL